MARATGAAALPDDVLRHILARVPDPVDLLRCAGTCRRWLRLIGDPAGGLLPETLRRASFLLGAFHQEAALVSALEPMKKESVLPPQFMRLHAAPAGGGRLTSTSFFPNDDGLFNYAKPLASRRGLLLVRTMPTPLDRRKLHLAVCHPLIGDRISTRVVPPPPMDLDPKLFGEDMTGYAIVTAADHGTAGHLDNHGQPAFQVILTAVHSDDQFVYACCYSSATDSWTAPIRCLHGLTMSGPRAGTVVHGMAHWLYRDKTDFYTLDINADSPHTASLTRIGIQVGRDLPTLQPPFPCIAGGKLSFVTRRNIGVLELWTKREQDDDHGSNGAAGWLCSELMFDDAIEITIFAFLESKGAMLVQNGNHLLTVDLESKEVEPVRGHGRIGWHKRQLCGCVRCQGRNSCGDCTYNRLVMYEMDWPSYLLRLSFKSEEH